MQSLSQYARVCVCSLRYPAGNAHLPYYLWSTRIYKIFPHYLINEMIFEKKRLNIKCEFWYSLQTCSETFLSMRRLKGNMILKNWYLSSCNVPVMLVRFEFNVSFLERLPKNTQLSNLIKIVRWEQTCSVRTDRRRDEEADGQTDRQAWRS